MKGLILLLLALYSSLTIAQVEPDHHGGGAYFIEHPVESESEHRKDAIKQLRAYLSSNRPSLRDSHSSVAKAVKFRWPIRSVEWLTDFYSHGFSNFVDHDPDNPDALLDFNCDTKTYDVVDYNHRGTDIFLWPFPWNKMAADEVEVIAAAAGKIILKTDGNDDDSCTFTGQKWNEIQIQHDDGSVAWYGHFKKNSLTQKIVGDKVSVGEFLGIVGSSGNSSIPHLHFEIYDAEGNLNDPFQGVCNRMNAESWWVEQPKYYEAAINRLTVGTVPILRSCPNPDITGELKTITAGSSPYFTAYFHGQRDTSAVEYKILLPDGSEFSSWEHTSNQPLYSASYWYWQFPDLAETGPFGVWTFSAKFETREYTHPFNVVPECNNGVDPSLDITLDLEGFCDQPIAPLTLANNQWRQISLPINPGATASLVDIFSSELSPRDYGNGWIIYYFDTATNRYIQAAIKDTLIPGVAYWIIQLSGNTVTLNLTDSIPSSQTPLKSPLAAANNLQWQMIGFPRNQSTRWDQIRITTDSGLCSDGCSLTTATAENLIHDEGWTYDGNNYQRLNDSDEIAPWTGIWVVTLPAAKPVKPTISASASEGHL